MLTQRARRRLLGIVLAWAVANFALQTLIHFSDIEYDSPGGASSIWWIAQAVALPVTLISELTRSIGTPLSGYGWYMALTCLLAVACVGLIRVASVSR